jgi:3(or 17)beta-hydroxysteroid dehydrogenase
MPPCYRAVTPPDSGTPGPYHRPMNRLDGKVALITGAGRGIGEATARALASHGCRVCVTDLLPDRAAAVAASIGPPASHALLDVRDESHWTRAVGDLLARAGRLDILVNNAGITGFVPPMGPQDPEHASLHSWHAVHATNLDGVFLGCKHAIAAMKPPRSGGSIINISSRSGQVGIPRAAAYASSKAAVRNHSKSVALYCAEMGYAIRCNSIHPGAVLTPMWDDVLPPGPDRDAALRDLAAEVPLGRMGSPADVASLVVFLASDESSYITGAEMVIDGGILAGSAATPKRP